MTNLNVRPDDPPERLQSPPSMSMAKIEKLKKMPETNKQTPPFHRLLLVSICPKITWLHAAQCPQMWTIGLFIE